MSVYFKAKILKHYLDYLKNSRSVHDIIISSVQATSLISAMNFQVSYLLSNETQSLGILSERWKPLKSTKTT